ncbi:FecR family protein [Saccharicrinis aurantiacus]|uniref:FecR family protein n=1 Tax=Saccharicrinis aurantiacus TaxID=1849719 RepID=UPI00094FB28C|nr:FecR family protein [Saccharicrinis aurantiacus]
MKRDKSHNNSKNLKEGISAFPEIEVSFSKSEAEVWSELSDVLSLEEDPPHKEQEQKKGKVVKLAWIKISAAAAIVMLLSVTSFSYLYTKSVITKASEHMSATLPDGSIVELNAVSKISYKPLWWKIDRKLQLDGEAFFKVKKGKSFTVESSRGRTIVLGTSFNVFARSEQYKVTCYTGKVRVVSVYNGHVTDIVPNESAEINTDGSIALRKLKSVDNEIMWMNDMFIFTSTPIKYVFEEIERQYNTKIVVKAKLNKLYSGNFMRNRSVEEVVKMVCLPLGLSFEKTLNGFVITETKIPE